jgi:hypothetical protein
MELLGANGDAVALEIIGYQFPVFRHEPWDSNWLNIRLTAAVDGRRWTAEDPSS